MEQKVWALSVSIHCEGCKKKIKKILSKVHGVSDVVIDGPQNKVTVTGSVEGDALVKRLAKFNKRAVLLPERKPVTNPNDDTAKAEVKPKEPATQAKPIAAPAKAAKNAVLLPEEEKVPKDDEGAAVRSRDVGEMYPFPERRTQPDYVMSYNAAQPSISHVSYAPPMQGYAYGPYQQPQYASPPRESYNGSADGGSSWLWSQHPAHIYDTVFSEENPNGCGIM